jgi:hypothetical protein
LNVDFAINAPMNFSFKKKRKSTIDQRNRDSGVVLNKGKDEKFTDGEGKFRAGDLNNIKASKNIADKN